MKKNKSIFRFGMLGLALMLCMPILPVSADSEDDYYVYDYASNTEIGTYSTWRNAYNAYRNNLSDYDNLAITQYGKVLTAEYAIAYITGSESSCAEISFEDEVTEVTSVIDGCSAIDAAYIGVTTDGEEALIQIGGARGYVSVQDIEIVPIQLLSTRLSMYTVYNNILYHEIKSEYEDDNYGSIVMLSEAPDYLENDTSYYSYDGHYFYDADFLWLMLQDIKDEVHDNAVNPDTPFYFYHQYVSQRSLTTATQQMAEDYLANVMMIKGPVVSYQDDEKDGVDDTYTRSQYAGHMDAFWQYQYQYGVNALMMLAVSANESSYGRSSLSYTRNNLYRHAAYDTSEEADAARFLNVSNSVYSHAKYYISGTYASPLKAQYAGSFFGNKASGMNNQYSSDPYWGEKTASTYRTIDLAIGSQDDQRYTLVRKSSSNALRVYQYAYASSNVLYLAEESDLVFTVTDEVEDENGILWYQIFCDATLDDTGNIALEYTYDYENDRAYIRADEVEIVSEGSGEGYLGHFAWVTFDANGGTFRADEQTVSYKLPDDDLPVVTTPTKDHALFIGWDIEVSSGSEDRTYVAQYKDVESISISSLPKHDYELNDRLDLSNGIVTVLFTDGTTEDASLTTDMISGHDMTVSGSQYVIVTYAGCTTSYEINISEEQDQLRSEILDEILAINELYGDQTSLDEDASEEILALKQKIDENLLPDLTQSQLRTLDGLMRLAIDGKIRYVVNPNTYNLQVSGLTVSMPLGDSLTKTNYLEDTYRVTLDGIISKESEDAMSAQASVLQYDVVDTLNFYVQKNYETVEYEYPIIITIDKPSNSDLSKVYLVLYYDELTGDVIRCYTRQSSNTISIVTKGNGSYLLLSRDTSNIYESEDPIESLNADSESTDVERYRIFISILSFVVLVIFFLLYRILRRRKNSKVVIERETKKEQQKNEPAPPVDVTQAFRVFETQAIRLNELEDTKMLSIEDIQKAEQENHD